MNITSDRLKEQVGQVFISFFYGEEFDDNAKEFFKETKLGNVIYYNWSNGLSTPSQVKKLSKEVHHFITETVGISPLIAVDQEGGRVARLRDGFTVSPGNAFLKNPEEAYRIGKIMAEEMLNVGINCNFAPVVDINSNPDNPVIGTRSFSSEPEHVISMGREMIRGFHDGGVLSVIKHFPGHGDTTSDSHHDLPVVKKSLEELEAIELKPFNSLKNDTDAIMTAHIKVPALDLDNPATTSKPILTDLLRKKWKYDGLIISDSLVMKGIAPNQKTFDDAVNSVSQAAIKAFQAGCDCLILGRCEWGEVKMSKANDLEFTRQVMENFQHAVEDGTISKERFAKSLERISSIKTKIYSVK